MEMSGEPDAAPKTNGALVFRRRSLSLSDSEAPKWSHDSSPWKQIMKTKMESNGGHSPSRTTDLENARPEAGGSVPLSSSNPGDLLPPVVSRQRSTSHCLVRPSLMKRQVSHSSHILDVLAICQTEG